MISRFRRNIYIEIGREKKLSHRSRKYRDLQLTNNNFHIYVKWTDSTCFVCMKEVDKYERVFVWHGEWVRKATRDDWKLGSHEKFECTELKPNSDSVRQCVLFIKFEWIEGVCGSAVVICLSSKPLPYLGTTNGSEKWQFSSVQNQNKPHSNPSRHLIHHTSAIWWLLQEIRQNRRKTLIFNWKQQIHKFDDCELRITLF